MENEKPIEKEINYDINQDDWNNIKLVEIKQKAKSVIYLFKVLENTLAPHITPVETELIDRTKAHLLKYLEDNFMNLYNQKV